jgi:hypothetical protein
MSRHFVSLALLTLLLPGAAVAQGQYYRDVIVLGGQHYLRTEQPPQPGDNQFVYVRGVGAQGGCCALTYNFWDGENEIEYVRQFDAWAEPLHDPAQVDPDPDLEARPPALTDRWGANTWVMWYDRRGVDEVVARIFDPGGEPQGPVFALAEVREITDGLRGMAIDAASTQTAAVWAQRGPSGGTQMDLYVRVFSPQGAPISDVITIGNSQTYSEQQPAVAVLSDGGVVVAYQYGLRGGPHQLYVRRVNPDFTVEAPVLVESMELNYVQPHLRALEDGTLLVAYGLYGLGDDYVRRLDAHGQPFGNPIPIDPGFSYAASTTDGRLALAGSTQWGVWMRLYDANWQPLTDRFDFTSGQYEQSGFSGPTFPLAYDDDGTIWIGWWGDLSMFLTSLKPFEPGDMNYDRRVDNFDITPFVMALADPAEYQAHYPGLPYEFLGDVNEDGAFDNFDITPFVHLLTGR